MIFIRIFILSFCSMSYQLLMARSLAETTSYYIFSYSVSFGFFLLGMGIGGIYYAKSLIQKSPLKVFFYIEIFLALLGGLAVFFIFFSHTFLNLLFFSDMNNFFSGIARDFLFILVSQIFLFLVGFFSGFELPIWLKLAEIKKDSKAILYKTGALLGASYMGGFAGSLLITLLIVPIFGLLNACVLIGLINLIVLIETFVSYKSLSLKKSFAILASIFLLYAGNFWQKEILQMNLKSSYLELGLSEFSFKAAKDFLSLSHDYEEILRVRTPYQNIDIMPSNFLKNSKRLGFSFSEYGIVLFLNRFWQFHQAFWVSNHEAQVVGGTLLAGKEPKNILILGGGDGLMISQMLKFYKGIKKITQIDIDSVLIKVGRYYRPISAVSKEALLSNKLTTIIGDGFEYVSKSKSTYDAVFIDVPMPYTFDLSRLYSFEFYKNLGHILEEDGFVVMDSPLKGCQKIFLFGGTMFELAGSPANILYSTLTYAGYKTIIAYGMNYTCILFFQKIKRDKIEFTKTEIEKYSLSKGGKRELLIHKDVEKNIKIKQKYINSVFKPTLFRY